MKEKALLPQYTAKTNADCSQTAGNDGVLYSMENTGLHADRRSLMWPWESTSPSSLSQLNASLHISMRYQVVPKVSVIHVASPDCTVLWD